MRWWCDADSPVSFQRKRWTSSGPSRPSRPWRSRTRGWIEHHPEVEPKSDVRDTPAPAMDSLYPRSFDEFLGQEEPKRLLQMEVALARSERRPMGHVLLWSPPGLGKTALAAVLANELGALLYPCSGSELQSQQDVIETFARVGGWWAEHRRPVLVLIDEIDAMSRKAGQVLHHVMTHGTLLWKGQEYGGVPLTIIGGTNHISDVDDALRSRFQDEIRLDFYTPEELAAVAKQAALKMGFTLTDEAAAFIGANGSGTPRVVTRRLLPHVRMLLKGAREAALDVAEKALSISGLHRGGLTDAQVTYLQYLAGRETKTAGLSSIAAKLGDSTKNVQYVVEPRLVHQDYVEVVPAGRRSTQRALEYLETV